MIIMLVAGNAQEGGISKENFEVNVVGDPPPGFRADGEATVVASEGKHIDNAFVAINFRCQNDYDSSLPSCSSRIISQPPGACLAGSECCVFSSKINTGRVTAGITVKISKTWWSDFLSNTISWF